MADAPQLDTHRLVAADERTTGPRQLAEVAAVADGDQQVLDVALPVATLLGQAQHAAQLGMAGRRRGSGGRAVQPHARIVARRASGCEGQAPTTL
jgi:hypothetical protein